jgi:O-antigen/teichoic acid export membrane protein
VVGVFCLFTGFEFIGSYLPVTNLNKQVYYIAVMQVPCFMLINFSQNLLKWTFDRKKFLIVSLGNTLTTLVVTLITVKFLKLGLFGAMIAFTTSRLIFAMVGIYFVRSWVSLRIFRQHIKPMFKYAAPYGCICLMSTFLPVLERSLISGHLGLVELGYYAAAAKVAMLVALPIYAFQTAWGPFYLSSYMQQNSPNVFRVVLTVYTALILGFAIVCSLLSEWLMLFLAGNDYIPGAKYAGFIALGLSVYSIASITSIGIDIKKRSEFKMFGYVISFAAFFLLAQPLLSEFDGGGVVIALLISYYIRFIIETTISSYLYKMNFGVLSSSLLVTLVVFSAVVVHVYEVISYTNFSFVVLILLSIFLIYGFMNMRSSNEQI